MDQSEEQPGETYLTIGFADGTEKRLTLGPHSDGNRLAVGTATNRSSIWRMFASKSKKGGSDVFITTTTLGTAQKVSLHESGVWRAAFHSEEHAAKYGHVGGPEHGGDPRLLDRWQRPEGMSGWTSGLAVFVPHGHLSPSTDSEDPKKPVTWLPEPRPGELTTIHFVVAKPDRGQLNLARTAPVGGFALPNGEAAIVMVSRAPTDEAVVRQHERTARELARAMVGEPPYEGEVRTAIFGYDEAGNRWAWDLSLQACFRHVDEDSA